jgi:perosamine synthetase
MQYWHFDPSPCSFPLARVPVLPALHWNSLKLTRAPEPSPLAPAPDVTSYSRGRYALFQAYQRCGVDAHSALLAPAYHCRTMLDPAIRQGAEIALYPLNPDLSPDIAALEALLTTCRKPVVALLITHYFGFAQTLEPLQVFCSDHGIALIEDCSHCLVGSTGTHDIGRLGRYSVWSPYKYFPCEDGGELWSNHDEAMLVRHPHRASMMQEIKGLVRTLRRSRASRQRVHTEELDREIEALANTPYAWGNDQLHGDPTTSVDYDPTQENRDGFAISRWIRRQTDVVRLKRERRRNYLQWLQVVSALPYCRALFPTLAPDCVPYMFPLCIDCPDIHFYALKRLGVPLWRWDSMAVSNCPVATGYRLQLLHLPCHQELTPEQMHWMTMAVTKVLQQVPMEPRA